MDDENLDPVHVTDETGAEKPYHSKRPHKKSRTGCKNCKARKVKCDEARPTCRSCRLRKVECVYAPSAPVKSPPLKTTHNTHNIRALSPFSDFSDPLGSSSSSQDSPPSAPIIVAEPLFHPSSVDASEMKLLWFYTNATCRAFSVNSGSGRFSESVMRGPLVQRAFETPFLMDSIFALSCLHLQSLEQDYDSKRAISYRGKSFEGYREAIEDAKPETFPALIANSLILTALSSQVFRDPNGKDLYIVDWMIVWKGISLMMDMIKIPTVFQSGMAALFYRPSMNLEESHKAIPSQLLFMISSIQPDDEEFSDVATYYETLKYIGALYHHLRDGLDPLMKLRIITWFTFIPKQFVELCRLYRPRTLVILAHYAMFLKLVDNSWWLSGIGNRTLHDIFKHLDSYWAQFMTVPIQSMEVEGHLAVGRLILGDDKWVLAQDKDNTMDLGWVDNEGKEIRFIKANEKFYPDPSSPGRLDDVWYPPDAI